MPTVVHTDGCQSESLTHSRGRYDMLRVVVCSASMDTSLFDMAGKHTAVGQPRNTHKSHSGGACTGTPCTRVYGHRRKQHIHPTTLREQAAGQGSS